MTDNSEQTATLKYRKKKKKEKKTSRKHFDQKSRSPVRGIINKRKQENLFLARTIGDAGIGRRYGFLKEAKNARGCVPMLYIYWLYWEADWRELHYWHCVGRKRPVGGATADKR